MKITAVVPTTCFYPALTYNLSVTVEYNAGVAGDIIITSDNGINETFTPAAASGTQTFLITGIAVSGTSDIDVTATAASDGVCTNILVDAYSEPICVCPPVQCGEVSVLKN